MFPIGTRRPDFVCGFADGSLGIFEAKGTTGSVADLTAALAAGKVQTAGIGSADPIRCRVAVGCALGGAATRVVLLDPPEGDDAKPTNLTADLVREAAKKMRKFPSKKRGGGEADGVCITAPTKTIFRGPDGQIALTHDDYKPDKRHGWLDIVA